MQDIVQELQTKYGALLSRAWNDPLFKQKLLHDTEAALADIGIQIPPGAQVCVVENTDTVTHLVIPPCPSESPVDIQHELGDDEDIAFTEGCVCTQQVTGTKPECDS